MGYITGVLKHCLGDTEIPIDDLKYAMRSISLSTQDES